MLPFLFSSARILCSLQFLLLSLFALFSCFSFPSAFSVYSWLKSILLLDCSFLLPHSLDLLPLSVGIPLLCIIITVMLHREVATCFLMNWVLVLFEQSLFLLLWDFPWNWFLRQLIGNVGSQILSASTYFPVESSYQSDYFSAIDLRPPDPMISIHIVRVSSMTFTHAIRAVFSLIC